MVEEPSKRMPPGSPLVGRDAQVELLDTALRRVAAGQFAVVEISGEAGAGKTRMLTEVARRARAAGLLVCSGAGTEFERSVPFGTYAEALRPLINRSGGEPGNDTGGGATLRALGGPVPPADPVSPADRFRIHAGIRGRLTGTALLLDDLHWTDQASAELTEYLIRKPPAAPALIAVTYRAIRPIPGVVDAIGHLADAGFRMDLPPLNAADLAALLPRVSSHRRALILKVSHGNPLYIEALSRLDDAALTDLADNPEPGGRDGANNSRQHLLGWLANEITALEQPAQRVAQAAAVVGEQAAIDLLAEVAQLPMETVAEAVDQMYRAGLIAVDGPWFRFRHPLLRAAAHGMAGPAWRVAAHGRAASYLRTHGGSAHVVAHHTERSARPGDEQAADILVEAGSALVTAAPAEAARWLGTALRILPATDRWRDRRPSILLNYARALGLSGELRRSWEVLQELRQATGPERAEALAFSATVARMRGDIDEADALLRAEDPAALRPAAEGRRQIELAALAALRVDPAAAVDHGGQALRLLDGEQNELAAAAEALRAWGALCGGRPDTALGYVRNAARLADAASDRALLPRVELFGPLAWVEMRLGLLPAATRHLARAKDIAQSTGRSSALPYLLVVEAMLEARRGRLLNALQRTEEAAAAARLIGSIEMQAMADAVRVRPLLWVSGPAAAVEVAERLSAAGRPRSSTWSRIAQLDHAVALAADGDAESCLPLLADPDGPWPTDPYTVVCRAATRAMVLARTGDTVAAADAAARAVAAADDAGLDHERGLAGFAAGYVAARDGRLDEAAQLAATAADRLAVAGAALDEARARHLAARAYGRSGDRPSERTELARASSGYRACGADWLLAALGTVHRAAGETAVADRTAGYPAETGYSAGYPAETGYPAGDTTENGRAAGAGAGTSRPASAGLRAVPTLRPADRVPEHLTAAGPLTSREQQIANLVATGLTNQEIASRLFLSRRTVESHVARIFAKLDVRSRVSMANLINRSS